MMKAQNFQQVEQHQFLPKFSQIQQHPEMISPLDDHSSHTSVESDISSETHDRLDQLKQLQQSCLFAPLQSTLKSISSETAAFEDPAVVYSLKCLKQVTINQAEEKPEKKHKGEKGSLDELLGILHSNCDFSRNHRSESIIPKEVEIGIKNIQDHLKDVFQEISKTRPLLPDELHARLTMMRFPLRDFAEAEREARIFDQKMVIRRNRQKRFLPSRGVRLMKEWLMKNSSNPYPSAEQKAEFARKGKLQAKQVEYWFINARARICGKRSRKP
jgi:hypothetical protein